MFKNISIRLKLTAITAASSLLALLLAAGGFLILDLNSYKAQISADLEAESRVLGFNGADYLKHRDKEGAMDILSGLQAQPQIEAAAFYTSDRKIIAQYTRSGVERGVIPKRPTLTGTVFADNKLRMVHVVTKNGVPVGYLFIEAGLDRWYARRDEYSFFVGVLVFVCLGVAILVGAKLQKAISTPIVSLAKTMHAVAKDEQYSRRLPKHCDDELGRLADGFNAMLSEIEKRDRELHEANEELEDRVRRRTLQLELEIDQRRGAQDELVKSQHALNDFFENATIGMHWLSSDGTILKANTAELLMVGYEYDDYIDRNIAELFAERSVATDLMQRLRAGQVLQGYEAVIRCKGGQLKEVEIDANVLWQAGKFVHARCFVRDLTTQKEAERALAAREVAERANLAKSEFLSRMSHELRTPMNSILGFSQLLEMDDLPADQQDSVRQIIGAGNHLLRLINEVLDISRIESGHLAISREAVPVADVIREVMSLVSPMADQKRVAVVSSVETHESAHVLADRQRLCQVLLNLASNAVKYNVGFGEVRIDVVRMEGKLRIRIADTGPGIPETKLGSLFTPFDRLGAEHTAVEGTGLGLALSKRLAEAMDGEIGIEPTAKGACFYIELPQAENPVEVVDLSHVVDATTTARPFDRDRTILLIEDNVSNVRLIEKILNNRPGIRLITAMQGGIGMQLAREHAPDLILLDLNLPDMHGEQVMTRLCEDSVTRSIPVAVVSADATHSQMERLRNAGAMAYLTKPLDVKCFIDLLDRVFDPEAMGRVA